MKTPYSHQPPSAFWRSAVAEQEWDKLPALYAKKFEIAPETPVATAGSCFAQHISRQLRSAGYSVMDVEPAPTGLSTEQANQFGYGLYSARYGNIYTVRHLLQLAEEVFAAPARPVVVWEKEGRFYDALRPAVEPFGLESADEVRAHRQQHLACVRDLFLQAELLIFTFGLTEAWVERGSGRVFPTCPGVLAGRYEPERYEFRNFRYDEVLADFHAFDTLVNSERRSVGASPLTYLITVSPVPLTATASDLHVLQASTYSKAVLRAVAGALYEANPRVDYFPSFEIVSAPWAGGHYYRDNKRDVTADGVAAVMSYFFSEHGSAGSEILPISPADVADEDAFCEEAILDALNG